MIVGAHHAETVIDELYGAVVFDGDANAAVLTDHVLKRFAVRDIQRAAVIMRAVNARDKSQAFYPDMFPFSGMVKGHRIGVAGCEPANGTGADAAEHGAATPGTFEKFVNAYATPEGHHHECVSASDVNDVRPRDFLSDLFVIRPTSNQPQYVDLPFPEIAEVFAQTEEALRSLEKAVELGLRQKDWMEKDSDLNSIRSQPRFQALLAQLRANPI